MDTRTWDNLLGRIALAREYHALALKRAQDSFYWNYGPKAPQAFVQLLHNQAIIDALLTHLDRKDCARLRCTIRGLSLWHSVDMLCHPVLRNRMMTILSNRECSRLSQTCKLLAPYKPVPRLNPSIWHHLYGVYVQNTTFMRWHHHRIINFAPELIPLTDNWRIGYEVEALFDPVNGSAGEQIREHQNRLATVRRLTQQLRDIAHHAKKLQVKTSSGLTVFSQNQNITSIKCATNRCRTMSLDSQANTRSPTDKPGDHSRLLSLNEAITQLLDGQAGHDPIGNEGRERSIFGEPKGCKQSSAQTQLIATKPALSSGNSVTERTLIETCAPCHDH